MQPVNRREYPDYGDIVTNPIDLTMLYKKTKKMTYETVASFEEDITLLGDNCRLYCSSRFPALPPLADAVVVASKKMIKMMEKELRAAEIRATTTATITNMPTMTGGMGGRYGGGSGGGGGGGGMMIAPTPVPAPRPTNNPATTPIPSVYHPPQQAVVPPGYYAPYHQPSPLVQPYYAHPGLVPPPGLVQPYYPHYPPHIPRQLPPQLPPQQQLLQQLQQQQHYYPSSGGGGGGISSNGGGGSSSYPTVGPIPSMVKVDTGMAPPVPPTIYHPRPYYHPPTYYPHHAPPMTNTNSTTTTHPSPPPIPEVYYTLGVWLSNTVPEYLIPLSRYQESMVMGWREEQRVNLPLPPSKSRVTASSSSKTEVREGYVVGLRGGEKGGMGVMPWRCLQVEWEGSEGERSWVNPWEVVVVSGEEEGKKGLFDEEVGVRGRR